MAAPMKTKTESRLQPERKQMPIMPPTDNTDDIIIIVDDDDDDDEETTNDSKESMTGQEQKDTNTTKLPEATQKLLKSLSFKNPGRRQFDMTTFDPENSEREMRKLRTTFQRTNMKQRAKNHVMYDEKGLLLNFGNFDLCDCLVSNCPGCHYPCEQCASTRCGVQCRCNRKWVYDHIENESGGDITKFQPTK